MGKRVFSTTGMALAGAIALLWAGTAWGQTGGRTQFFFPGSVGFDAIISTVSSGPFLAQQAIVSADEKYVTINTNATNTGLVSLIPYTFTNIPNGFVGEATPVPAAGAKRTIATKPVPSAPTVLDRPGMTFIAPLKD